MSEAVSSRRGLNRALLARQMLLERVAMPARDAIERLRADAWCRVRSRV